MKTKNPSNRRRAFLTGVGSLIDLRGETTFRRAQQMMPPPPPPRAFPQAFLSTGSQFHQSFRSN